MSTTDSGLVDESDPTGEARALRVLFDGLPAMIGYWDADLRNVIANEAYVDWFGVAPQEMKGRHISQIVSPAIYAANAPFMTAALQGQQQTFQRTLVDVTGVTRHAQVSYSPDTADGVVVGLFVMITDVTAQVEAQRELDEAQELAELGSWTMIPATGEITWSRQLYALLRKDPETFVPARDSLVPELHPDDLERVLRVSSAAVEAGEGYDLVYRLVGSDAEVREVHSRARAEHDADGVVTRLTGTIQDVTSSSRLSREMTRVNEELRQVNQLNADVLGVVGHDVRTPLALVLGHLEELTATWDETTEQAKLARVDRVSVAAHRLSSLIDDILAMANFDSGTIATRPMRVELEEVVRDALTSLHGGADVEVRVQGTPIAMVDPFHLRQMVANLVSNALRYGAAPVVVSVIESAVDPSIEVTDHGAGVPEEFVPHLFERFTRATTGTAAQQRGSGFGLYIVGRLAEANGCTLTYSPAPGSGGSRFRLRLRPPSA